LIQCLAHLDPLKQRYEVIASVNGLF
jgi:hypothetical protein